MKITTTTVSSISGLLLVIGGWLLVGRLPQDPAYHMFADRREFFSIPNANDVGSSLLFCAVGLFGYFRVMRAHAVLKGYTAMYLAFFVAVFLTGIGSAYYHLDPNNATLVWDRLPMALAFTSILAAILSEFMSIRLGRRLFPWLLIGAAVSVLYWYWFDDLRPYGLVQFGSLLTMAILLIRFDRAKKRMLLLALACYVVAKLLEVADSQVFEASHNLVSGHTLKHVAAALGAFLVALRLSGAAR